MSVTKTLFLLTKTYPFGYGEQYITNELPYLAQEFKKVLIYPNDYYGDGLKHDKNLPENVEVLNLNVLLNKHNSNKAKDLLYLIKQTCSEFFSTDDRTNFYKNFKWNLINFFTQIKLAGVFGHYLNQNNYNNSNSVFYSYWFHKSASLLGILKDKGQINAFVSRAHSIDLYHQKWGIINEQVKVPPFKMFKLKHTNEIMCVSEHGRQILTGTYPKYSKKITVKYLGISSSHTMTAAKEDNGFHIVTCSGLDANKRVHKLAQALALTNKDVVWTHFGTGSLKNELDLATQKLKSNVKFNFMGQTPNHVINDFYKSNKVSLFVNLSIVEGIPVSIMEAMANHIPVLATSIYGVPEAVNDNVNGFLLDVNFTLEQLKEKIEYCIEHPDQLLKMGEASSNIFQEKFSAEKNYKNFAHYLASK